MKDSIYYLRQHPIFLKKYRIVFQHNIKFGSSVVAKPCRNYLVISTNLPSFLIRFSTLQSNAGLISIASIFTLSKLSMSSLICTYRNNIFVFELHLVSFLYFGFRRVMLTSFSKISGVQNFFINYFYCNTTRFSAAKSSLREAGTSGRQL